MRLLFVADQTGMLPDRHPHVAPLTYTRSGLHLAGSRAGRWSRVPSEVTEGLESQQKPFLLGSAYQACHIICPPLSPASSGRGLRVGSLCDVQPLYGERVPLSD